MFGVLASALAVLVSIHFGISRTFWIGAGCYAALTPCLVGLRRLQVAGLDPPGARRRS